MLEWELCSSLLLQPLNVWHVQDEPELRNTSFAFGHIPVIFITCSVSGCGFCTCAAHFCLVMLLPDAVTPLAPPQHIHLTRVDNL